MRAEPTGAPVADARGMTPGQDFLTRFVERDGRVTRHDQGGDTVSEGQSYAMLIALAEGDSRTFKRVWHWTRDNLQRPDGLLSWHWANGAVTDRSAASDADLDAARALVLAGSRFRDRGLRADGVRLAQAVLEHLTVPTPHGRLLVAGDWATRSSPWWFNPSYVSPVATHLLEGATGDYRWQQVEEGSRAAVVELTQDGSLPPDWARVDEDGRAWASPSPGGTDPRYGWDAARTIVRHAESCLPVDQQVAAWAAPRLGIQELAHAELRLDGAPLIALESPVARAARAAAYARTGWFEQALQDLEAGDLLERNGGPTYYGAAWAVLGRTFLTDRSLGGCPPLGEMT